jgi:hypothetical protein
MTGFRLAAHLLDARALNPQPLPPEPPVEDMASLVSPSKLDLVALNPQPLPPGPPDDWFSLDAPLLDLHDACVHLFG